jgi:kinesin family protein 5
MEEEAFSYLNIGTHNRAVTATNMNNHSSRSHMVFIINLHITDIYTGQAKSAKVILVDLAGSEKISKTGAEGKVLEEAKKINTSLTTLGKVINALSDGKSQHVPYRDSKLTRLLQ